LIGDVKGDAKNYFCEKTVMSKLLKLTYRFMF
jgi:hypothetical protein